MAATKQAMSAMVTFTTRYETLGCLVISLSLFAKKNPTHLPKQMVPDATYTLHGSACGIHDAKSTEFKSGSILALISISKFQPKPTV